MEYIKQKSELYKHFISFIDNKTSIYYIEDLYDIIKKYKCLENPDEFKTILYLISKFTENHHRQSNFLDKIEQILSYYSEYLKQNFTNEELFHIFAKCPQILLFLLNHQIMTIDDFIIKSFLNKKKKIFSYRQYSKEENIDFGIMEEKYNNKTPIFSFYKYYFFNQIKSEIDEKERSKIEKELFEKDQNIFSEFDSKCRSGENDSCICRLIREDAIQDFTSHVAKTNISLNSEVTQSIFESRPFLASKPATLIEYAAFFGSIKIFNFLRMNEVPLTPELWLYAIHGNNTKIIHILEDNFIAPPGNSYMECMKESIKCHHNEFAHYFQSKLKNDENKESDFMHNQLSYGFHYYNYEFINEFQNLQYVFFYACKYDNLPIVEILSKYKKADINQKIILKYIFHEGNNQKIINFIISNQEFYKNNSAILFILCQKLVHIEIPSFVTSIRSYAFYRCESLTNISISSSIESIRDYAFAQCSSLTSISIPSSVKSLGPSAFSQCSSLTNVSLPSSLESIESNCFSECSALKSISIPSSIKIIAQYAFSNCKSLTDISLPSSLESIGYNCFSGCSSLVSISIPSSVKSIEESAFYNCNSLTSISLPPSLKFIERNCFSGCSSLVNISIPSSVVLIRYGAFQGCSSLISISIPSSITVIESNAFNQCSSLSNVSIPNSITSIENEVFGKCTSLSNIKIPLSVNVIKFNSFAGCSSLKRILIPSSVKSIGGTAFNGCTSLQSVLISSSITAIPTGAFMRCTSLVSITIPSSVTTIFPVAFSFCTSLSKVTIPSSVTKIGFNAFAKCSSLPSISIPSSVVSIEKNVFLDCSSLKKITIPSSLDSSILGLNDDVQIELI